MHSPNTLLMPSIVNSLALIFVSLLNGFVKDQEDFKKCCAMLQKLEMSSGHLSSTCNFVK